MKCGFCGKDAVFWSLAKAWGPTICQACSEKKGAKTSRSAKFEIQGVVLEIHHDENFSRIVDSRRIVIGRISHSICAGDLPTEAEARIFAAGWFKGQEAGWEIGNHSAKAAIRDALGITDELGEVEHRICERLELDATVAS